MKGQKGKTIAAGVLLCVALVSLYFGVAGSSSEAFSKPDAASAHQDQLHTLTQSDPTYTAPAGGGAKHGPKLTDLQSIDPVLRVDLLAKAQGVDYIGSDRNIFQFYTPPPPPKPIPQPIVTPVIGNDRGRGPDAPVTAPPPPPIPLKYYGVVTTIGSSARKACLQDKDGDDIYVAAEGDLVKKRYRVLHINDLGSDHSVEVEDTQNKNRSKIPLQEGDKS